MPGKHKRETAPMLESARCGAKTRSGHPCRAPAVKGRPRCRMHGCGRGSGAPKRNQNAQKHGAYKREAMERRQEIRGLLSNARKLCRDLSSPPKKDD